MSSNFFLIGLAAMLYAGIYALEMSAVLARLAGYRNRQNMTGYALQQTIYMATRLLLTIFLPMVGLIVDRGLSLSDFRLMAHLSLALAAVCGAIVILFRLRLVAYYSAVLQAFERGGGYMSALLTRPQPLAMQQALPLRWPRRRSVWLSATIVFTIYGCGIFVSFFLALLFHEYRAAISQTSGAVNALGAFLLTFFVEPRIARGIDGCSDDAEELILALIYGRMIAVVFTGQLLLAVVLGLLS